jgi:putative membrane protein
MRLTRRWSRTDVGECGTEPDPRFTLANERTLLAWNRTALALIGGGLAAGKLLDFSSSAGRLLVALPPIVLGALLALVSLRRWELNQRALRLRQPLPLGGPARLLAWGLIIVAVAFAVIGVVDVFAR